MSTAAPSKHATPPAYNVFAGVLSYLVPGLGQISQGRIGKGLLFFVCVYTLFFYGIYLGTYEVMVENDVYRLGGNVYLPDNAEQVNPFSLRPRLLANLYNRPQFLGQFWVGIAAWPAIWQYLHYDEQAEANLPSRIAELKADGQLQQAESLEKRLRDGDPLFGQFERTPTEKANNAVQNATDKRFDLSWVYTVIAGVLNIMVIYDALAGPAFPTLREQAPSEATA
jgi:hypothetical protein